MPSMKKRKRGTEKLIFFWELDAKVCDFVDSISNSGDAKRKLFMTGDTKTKDAKPSQSKYTS